VADEEAVAAIPAVVGIALLAVTGIAVLIAAVVDVGIAGAGIAVAGVVGAGATVVAWAAATELPVQPVITRARSKNKLNPAKIFDFLLYIPFS